MTTGEHAIEAAAQRQPLAPSRWHPLRGATTIFKKELLEWFRTRRFLVMTVLTSLMLAAVPVILFLHEGGLHDGRINSGYNGLLESWVALLVTLASYLIVALTMGMLVKEEETGTAQWLFTKPVSRTGYVLAKYAANATAVIAGAILIPSAVFLGLVQVLESTGVRDWGAVGLTSGFIILNALVVLGLVTALSGFFRSAAPVAGIAIGLNFVPLFFFRLNEQFAGLFPINIGEIASQAVHGRHLTPWEPVVSGIVIAVVGVAFACVRISRRQLQ